MHDQILHTAAGFHNLFKVTVIDIFKYCAAHLQIISLKHIAGSRIEFLNNKILVKDDNTAGITADSSVGGRLGATAHIGHTHFFLGLTAGYGQGLFVAAVKTAGTAVHNFFVVLF